MQVYKRSFWTETFVAWSPHGSYLATMHRQGAAIWGGPSFSRLQRFSHPNVRAPRNSQACRWHLLLHRCAPGSVHALPCAGQRVASHRILRLAPALFDPAQVRLIQFSPEETFLVSYSPVEPTNPREKAGLVLNIFDSRTGRKLRNFAGSAEDYAVGAAAAPGGALKWPVFQWAGGCGDRRARGECVLERSLVDGVDGAGHVYWLPVTGVSMLLAYHHDLHAPAAWNMSIGHRCRRVHTLAQACGRFSCTERQNQCTSLLLGAFPNIMRHTSESIQDLGSWPPVLSPCREL